MQFCYLDNQQYSSKLAWPCNLGSHKGLQLPSSEAIWPQLHYSSWLLLIWPIGNSLETLEARNGLFSSFWGNCLLVDRIILCPSSTSYSLSLLGPIQQLFTLHRLCLFWSLLWVGLQISHGLKICGFCMCHSYMPCSTICQLNYNYRFHIAKKDNSNSFFSNSFFYDVSFAPSPTVFLMNVTSFHNVSFKLFEDNFSSSQRLGIQQLITHRRTNNMTYQFCSIAR